MNVHRIFCIGKNYAAHVQELAHLDHRSATASSNAATASGASAPPADESCVVFMKPPSAVVPVGQPIVLPRDAGSLHHEAELVVRLGQGGRNLTEEQALARVGQLTLGLDLTLRDLQTKLRNAGKPWELSKAFDGSAPLGDWTDYDGFDLQALVFNCHVNGALRQRGDTSQMLFPVTRLIHILSRTWTLQPGDVIFTGTPAGVGPLVTGDEVVLDSQRLGRYAWQCL